LLHQFSKSDREKAWDILKRLDIEDQAMKLARELSGGQQQRVGISRALMQDPELILADEPVASLDPVLAHSILNYLELLNKEDQLTIICSLHYLDLVQRYASRVIGLRAGKLVYEGSREEIRKMTDEEFKSIYGEEAERITDGIEGVLERSEVL
jgi:phosphonate transport system ATP-binding protein